MTDGTTESDPADLREVRLLEFPLDVHQRVQEHYDELMREFALIALQETDGESHHAVPRRLLRLIDALTAQYGGITEAPDAERDAAAARGEKSIDLSYRVPADARQACIDLDRMLDEADEFCRRGDHLLTLASTPEGVAYRRWYLSEFVTQIDGGQPTPWPQYRAEAS